jgi:hypothetical protein
MNVSPLVAGALMSSGVAAQAENASAEMMKGSPYRFI